MAATNQGWSAYASNPALTITSSANLATGDTLITGSFNNTPNLSNSPQAWTSGDLELYLPNGLSATVSVEQPVEIYFLTSLDGTNYADFDSNFTDVLAPQNLFVSSFMVRAEATDSTAQRIHVRDVVVPPYNFKLGIRNNTGVSLVDGASHFTVKLFLKSPSYS